MLGNYMPKTLHIFKFNPDNVQSCDAAIVIPFLQVKKLKSDKMSNFLKVRSLGKEQVPRSDSEAPALNWKNTVPREHCHFHCFIFIMIYFQIATQSTLNHTKFDDMKLLHNCLEKYFLQEMNSHKKHFAKGKTWQLQSTKDTQN